MGRDLRDVGCVSFPRSVYLPCYRRCQSSSAAVLPYEYKLRVQTTYIAAVQSSASIRHGKDKDREVRVQMVVQMRVQRIPYARALSQSPSALLMG